MLAEADDATAAHTLPPTRALIVMPLATQRGGAEVALLHLLEYREEARLEPTVAFLEPGPMVDWCREHGVPAVVIDAGRLRQLHRVARTVRALTRIAKEMRAQVVVSWMAKPHLYGAPAAMAAGIPSMWVQMGSPAGFAALDRIATLLPSRDVIVVSRSVQRAQARLLPRRPTTVVHLAVDLMRFDPVRIGDVRAARRDLGLPEDGLIVGSVGRLDSWKGFDVMLASVPAVLERHPDVTFVIVGGPHEFNPGHATELAEQARRLGLGDRVRLVGPQRNPETWMQAMDVFIHAAQNEPFGLVVIEAMALGKAVIASAEGGPTEVITPGADGLLSPYGDARALAQATVRLLGDPGLRSGLGAEAQRRAQDFSVQHYAAAAGAAIGAAALPAVAAAA
ncbi:MAG: glycosyltransferase family 4 protein [Conexibacteraceae bacterium]|nr:glycosyltransferase family 4 protein [Conexibacteraceae bacterium]